MMGWLFMCLIALETVDGLKSNTAIVDISNENNNNNNESNNAPVVVDGMLIDKSTTFAKGSYQLIKGLTINANNVVIDFGNSLLLGVNMTGVAITTIGVNNVTLRHVSVEGFYYGVVFVNCSGLVVSDVNLSSNYRDPLAFASTPPWLDINVVPAAFNSDRTNLGGGLWLERVHDARISHSKFMQQGNGIDAFFLTNSIISHNDVSFNVGWGIHLYKSSNNTISNNRGDYCTRGPGHYTCDTAGLLMNCGSNYNSILNNSFRFGGDGIFVSGFPRNNQSECCPSNHNVFQGNDVSWSPNNAIECTFGTGNRFIANKAIGANYGFWLGYSRDNYLSLNLIANSSTCGVAIDHGQDSTIEGNTFVGNGQGIALWTDMVAHYPYTCINQSVSSSDYVIRGNIFSTSSDVLVLVNSSNIQVYNNAFQGGATSNDNGGTSYSLPKPVAGKKNIVGGSALGGNYWSAAAKGCSGGGGVFGPPFRSSTMTVADAFPLCPSSARN